VTISPEVGAGGRPPSASGVAAAEESELLGAPRGLPHGPLESHLEEASKGALQPDTP